MLTNVTWGILTIAFCHSIYLLWLLTFDQHSSLNILAFWAPWYELMCLLTSSIVYNASLHFSQLKGSFSVDCIICKRDKSFGRYFSEGTEQSFPVPSFSFIITLCKFFLNFLWEILKFCNCLNTVFFLQVFKILESLHQKASHINSNSSLFAPFAKLSLSSSSSSIGAELALFSANPTTPTPTRPGKFFLSSVV